jgi:hypothetical protein
MKHASSKFVRSAAFRLPHLTFALLVLSLLAAGSAAALPQRTFVASYGSDASPTCSLAAPCRSFNAAIAQTNAGGEVVILDTAGYGPMAINKSLTVIGPTGVYGGISVITAGSDGVTINAGNGDTIKLRGLDITGLGGMNGINVINAAGVHIEKSTVSNFGDDTGACIAVNAAAVTLRVYIVDSFLRQCRVGVLATGSSVIGNRSSVTIDNSRLERGLNTGASVLNFGVLQQGFIDVLIRNSALSRYSSGVRLVDPVAGGIAHLAITGSEITRSNAAIQAANTIATGVMQITLKNSQLISNGDGISVSNTAVGGNAYLSLVDTEIAYSSTNGVTLDNSAPDPNTRMYADMTSSQITNMFATAIDLRASNGSKSYLIARDSSVSHAVTGVKTTGPSPVSASLVRSDLHQLTTAIDHQSGVVRLDGNHVVKCANDFVNNGSGNIVSNGYNMVHDIDNLSGFTYITPVVIPLK